MHFQRAASMHSGLRLLRLDTDLESKQAHTGIPTPVSANNDDRKLSMSSWSFIGQPSTHASQSSSVSTSFVSCPEPTTREHHGLPMDFASSFSSGSSYDTVATTPEAIGRKANYHDEAYMGSSPCDVAATMGFSDAQWTMAPRPFTGNVYTLPSHGANGLMSACGDLTSMSAPLSASPSPFDNPYTHEDTASWNPSPYASHYISMSQPSMHENHMHIPVPYDGSYPFSLPARGVLLSNADAQAYVNPVETMPPTFEDIEDYDVMEAEDYLPPSPTKSEPGDFFGHGVMPVKEEYEEEKHDLKLYLSQNALRARSRKVLKRKGKSHRACGQPSMHRSRSGRDYHLGNISCTGTKKLSCQELNKKGKICGMKFARSEHLKRHVDTHDENGKVYFCPLPAKWNCLKSEGALDKDGKPSKGLGRKDNWRDHLKTHLRQAQSGAGRNKRVPREVLYTALRDMVGDEAAEETMKMVDDGLRNEEVKKDGHCGQIRARL